MFPDLPPQIQERVVCAIVASIKYEVPTNIMLAVAEKEGGKPGLRMRNDNGTHDIGWMQFNTAYLKELERYGIKQADAAAPGCYSFDLAAWRIRRHIKYDRGDIWTNVSNYHSRTEKYNTIYKNDLQIRSVKWAYWIENKILKAQTPKSAPEKEQPREPVRRVIAQK